MAVTKLTRVEGRSLTEILEWARSHDLAANDVRIESEWIYSDDYHPELEVVELWLVTGKPDPAPELRWLPRPPVLPSPNAYLSIEQHPAIDVTMLDLPDEPLVFNEPGYAEHREYLRALFDPITRAGVINPTDDHNPVSTEEPTA
jgi:hypothetical protein